MSYWFSNILFGKKSNNNVCDQCSQKFEKYDELIAHARHDHHETIVKCHDCGIEFIHEKDKATPRERTARKKERLQNS